MLVDFEVTLKVKLFFIFVQNKCVPYWPELHSTKEVGRYVVSCELEREAGDYKIRVLEIAPLDQVTYKHQTLTSLWFLISAHLMISPGFDLSCPPPPHSQPKHVRKVWHYQYLSWPDHGVPQESSGVLGFLTQVNSKQAEFPNAGPMIVHCRYLTAATHTLH